ncbi:MAG: hypothetical protein KA479_05815 [Saprospiraceae bacterium]|jgi:hypothetical protein|nr:hypothetical protein [Saprospiraceae bacterium]
MKPYLHLSLLILVLLGFIACEKKSDELPFPVIPSLQLLEVSQSEVVEFQDTLEFLLFYQDGDGDLGNFDPDIPGLIVKDERLSEPDSFHLQPLAPAGVTVPIQGELRVRLPQLFLLGNGNSETTRFKIKLLDRAGNESNEVQTTPIKIIR